MAANPIAAPAAARSAEPPHAQTSSMRSAPRRSRTGRISRGWNSGSRASMHSMKRSREARSISLEFEDRVIEKRQPAGHQQAEKPAGNRQQQHDLESRDHESRPAVIGPPADIYRIAPGLAPPLDEIAPEAADQPGREHQQRQPDPPPRAQGLDRDLRPETGCRLRVREIPIRANAAPPPGSRPRIGTSR